MYSLPSRHSMRLKGYDYAQKGLFFELKVHYIIAQWQRPEPTVSIGQSLGGNRVNDLRPERTT